MAADVTLHEAAQKAWMGPLEVVFDPDSSAVKIYSFGGLDLSILRPKGELSLDHVGVYDLYTMGDGGQFELTIRESSLEVLDILFPDAITGTDGAATYRGIGYTAGRSVRGDAQKVQIRPYASRNDSSRQIVLWLVAPTGDISDAMGPDTPQAYSVEFRAFPDLAKSEGQTIGRIYETAR